MENHEEQPGAEELRQQLKTIRDKCELQNKKIKLYRKENEEYKQELTRQAQVDSSLLLNSKELSEANGKLQSAIHDISLKLEIQLQSGTSSEHIRSSRPVALVTVKDITVTEETEEVDLPNEEINDEDIAQLASFKGIKSLLLGENKIGSPGLATITSCLTNVVKLQLNANAFQAEALKDIANLQQLRVLDVRSNQLGDGCMVYLGKLTLLTELSVSKNNITDEGIHAIAALTQLVYLDLTTNLVTDQGVGPLLGFKKLTHLYLMSNRLTEVIVPSMFTSLQSLEVLDVRFNINENGPKEALRAAKPAQLQLFC